MRKGGVNFADELLLAAGECFLVEAIQKLNWNAGGKKRQKKFRPSQRL